MSSPLSTPTFPVIWLPFDPPERPSTAAPAESASSSVAKPETLGERLAVVETEVRTIKGDVAEIKRDVKSLVAASIILKAVPWAALVTAIVALWK